MSVVSVDDGTYTRPMYAGAVIATVRITGSIQLFSVRGTSFEKPVERGAATVETFVVGDLPTGSEWESLHSSSTGRPDLTQARVVVSGGRPLKDMAAFEEFIGALADLLGGAVGATRTVVDAGIVGTTYRLVRPARSSHPTYTSRRGFPARRSTSRA